jgi:hypothetical protein
MLQKNNIDNLRFSELVEDARLRVAGLFPAWSDLNTHDPGIMLIELLSWLTETQRFHMAQSERIDVFFPLLGIVPQPSRPAFATAAIPGGSPIHIPAGVPVMAEGIRFETLGTVEPGDGSLSLIQKHTFTCPIALGNANGFPNQKFYTDTHGQTILPDSFSLAISGVLWTLIDDFRFSGPGDPHFALDAETGVISFGDGIRGLMPKGDVVIASISMTQGIRGNITSGQLTELRYKSHVIPLLQSEPAFGGAERESAEEAVARWKGEKRQAVTAGDIERLVMETPGVGLETALAFASEAKRIIIAAKPCGEQAELTEGQKRAIRVHLEPYRLAGYEYRIHSPKYIPVKMNVELVAHRHETGLVYKLESEIRRYFNDTYGCFTTVCKHKPLLKFISGCDGVAHIASCAMRTYSPLAHTDISGDILLPPGSLPYLDGLQVRLL